MHLLFGAYTEEEVFPNDDRPWHAAGREGQHGMRRAAPGGKQLSRVHAEGGGGLQEYQLPPPRRGLHAQGKWGGFFGGVGRVSCVRVEGAEGVGWKEIHRHVAPLQRGEQQPRAERVVVVERVHPIDRQDAGDGGGRLDGEEVGAGGEV